MYKIFNGKSWIEFSRYEYLINWVTQFNRNTRGEFTNSFLNHVGVNQNDVYFAGRMWTEFLRNTLSETTEQ